MTALLDLDRPLPPAGSLPEGSAVIPPPQLPHVQRELIARATAASPRWQSLARMQLSDQEIGMGRHNDHANASVLRRIIGEYGWPGVPLVGEDGATAAWQIALHADTDAFVQRAAARAMYGATQRGTASIRQWAHLHDRCLLNAASPQLFGTQYLLGADGPERRPVRDLDTLDTRRAEVGLPPAVDALRDLRLRLAAAPRTSDQKNDGASTTNSTESA
ncbi:DUF6624 domain-containing protein [Streptomyces microflavus]|uniref:DUF6624 domain-containing protein n=1 Tax=Streptomyces microflavus TaxID=1919 RepID=UPI003653D0A1